LKGCKKTPVKLMAPDTTTSPSQLGKG